MTCYLCEKSDFQIRNGAVRDEPDLQILECNNCGLVTLSSFKHVKKGHYEESGMHGNDLPPMQAWLNETEEDDHRRFKMLEPNLTNSKMLDFGCGAAGFLRKAMTRASEIAGVEPEQRVHDFWDDSIPLYTSLEDVGGNYDLITAFHVVEHLPDPRAILVALAEHLKDNGRIVIEVPNSEDALLTLYENDAFQRFTYWSQHLFYFNADTLRKLANQAGLRITSIKQFQRYPISNHMHWLSKNKPGGHKKWSFLDTPSLVEAYAASLASIGKCDTLIAYLEKTS